VDIEEVIADDEPKVKHKAKPKSKDKPKHKPKPKSEIKLKPKTKTKARVEKVIESSINEVEKFLDILVDDIPTSEIYTDNQVVSNVEVFGTVQVDDKIILNEHERNMLSNILTSNDRGHIIQVFNDIKIMDFNIDNITQLNHIERQISKFSDINGSYVVYLVWESELKYRITLSQKLKYNPIVRYK